VGRSRRPEGDLSFALGRLRVALGWVSPSAPNETLRELVSILGEEEARGLVQEYLEEFPQMLRLMASGAPEERRRVAHTLKSSARHVGADSLSQKMAALEARLAAPGAHVTQEDLLATAEEFEKTAVPLRTFARPGRPTT
jgi:HPt (histidine-containing phosphotransfer) domain-containing protein